MLHQLTKGFLCYMYTFNLLDYVISHICFDDRAFDRISSIHGHCLRFTFISQVLYLSVMRITVSGISQACFTVDVHLFCSGAMQYF